jgi:hypothetical protein
MLPEFEIESNTVLGIVTSPLSEDELPYIFSRSTTSSIFLIKAAISRWEIGEYGRDSTDLLSRFSARSGSTWSSVIFILSTSVILLDIILSLGIVGVFEGMGVPFLIPPEGEDWGAFRFGI